jgi:hypothetical protein
LWGYNTAEWCFGPPASAPCSSSAPLWLCRKVGFSGYGCTTTPVLAGAAAQPWDPEEAGGFLANFLQSPAALW